MVDGQWMLEINVKLQSVNMTNASMTISGITSLGGNTQALAGGGGGTSVRLYYMRIGGNNNIIDWGFDASTGDVLISGTFSIQSKPTWAY